jgi:dihydroorotate dehydrogenase
MDLTTNYLGLSLRSPMVPSASPLSEKIDNIRAMEQAGAAAVVFHSLFEEQIEATARNFASIRTRTLRTSRKPSAPSAFQSSAV